jgi:signal transduction histidine kinase
MKSNSTRVTVLVVLFLLTSVALAAAQDQTINMKEHQLTKKEVKALIVSAKTPEDHLKLASYFKGEARQQEASAMYHEEMAELYDPKTQMTQHCKSLAESLKNAAEAASSMAAEHEKMAAQARENK